MPSKPRETASNVGWSAPGTVRIEGGSVGFQIGGSTTDLIMLVMTERGADKLLESKFTLGVEGSVAAGPVGRTATAQTEQRGTAVRDFLAEQGIPASALTTRGFGESKPVVSNDTATGRQQNRRVELVVSGEIIGQTGTPTAALQ